MKLSTSALLASVIVAAAAAPASENLGRANRVFPRNDNIQQNVVGAAFFLTNDPTGNLLMASTIGPDGRLTTVRAVSTGGTGAHGQTSPTGPDALFSQGAIKEAGGKALFAVNPGSNTLSMFNLNPNDPANPALVGVPADTQGTFPMSVAPNAAGTVACVLNGGSTNGVACFSADPQLGLSLMNNTVRSLGINQTTPATGPPGTTSHIIFSEDGTQLIASVKGAPPNPGFLAVWDVAADGSLSETFNAITPPTGGALPFGMAVIPNTTAVLATDPAVGYTIIDLAQLAAAGNNAAAGTTTTAITSDAASNIVASGKSTAVTVNGQKAVCWAAFSSVTQTFFLTDVGTSIVTEASVDPSTLASTVVAQHNLTAGSGTLDDAIGSIGGQDFLYVLSANASSVDVFALAGPGNVSHLETVSFANAANELGVTLNPNNLQGMAIFIPAN